MSRDYIANSWNSKRGAGAMLAMKHGTELSIGA